VREVMEVESTEACRGSRGSPGPAAEGAAPEQMLNGRAENGGCLCADRQALGADLSRVVTGRLQVAARSRGLNDIPVT
jgi:hypothetical protein